MCVDKPIQQQTGGRRSYKGVRKGIRREGVRKEGVRKGSLQSPRIRDMRMRHGVVSRKDMLAKVFFRVGARKGVSLFDVYIYNICICI